MRRIVQATRRPPAISGRDRDGGFAVAFAGYHTGGRRRTRLAMRLHCDTSESPRRARLAENHGKPSLGVFTTSPWY